MLVTSIKTCQSAGAGRRYTSSAKAGCRPSAGPSAEQSGEQSEERSRLAGGNLPGAPGPQPVHTERLGSEPEQGGDGGGLVEEETLQLECVTEEGAQQLWAEEEQL